jgi:uncharacterized membrane protein
VHPLNLFHLEQISGVIFFILKQTSKFLSYPGSREDFFAKDLKPVGPDDV